MDELLTAFESAVYGRPHLNRQEETGKAASTLLRLLQSLREGGNFTSYGTEKGVADYTRLASAIIAFFVDPEFILTQEGFDCLAAERGVIETLFKASAYGSADHVFGLIKAETEHVNKFLLLFQLDSELGLDLDEVFAKDPQATFGLYLSLVGYAHVFGEKAHVRREWLLTIAQRFENVALNPVLYNTLCTAYMHCSYASGENKHAMKAVLHHVVRRNLLPYVQEKSMEGRQVKERPTIVIVFEWWHGTHAMYRSYAKSIEQLKQRFRVIGLCPSTHDDAAKKMFDDWIDVSHDPMTLSEVAGKIQAIEPDIIYYPSIGMAIWAVAMASLRLAPTQVMSYGHPATSMSPFIDYGIIEGDCYDADCFNEKVICLPPNTVRPTPFEQCLVRHKPRRTDTVRIGVVAMQVKVTWPFVQALQAVQAQADKKVEVKFFGAAHGVGLYSMAGELGRSIANLNIQEVQPYAEYMADIAQCDLVLFSFPFGGANSMYDALTLGIPMVSLEGKQPHSKSDASIIRRAGIPENLIAQSVPEYVKIILRLLDDDQRIAVANQIAALDLDAQFHGPDKSNAFLAAFEGLYDAQINRLDRFDKVMEAA